MKLNENFLAQMREATQLLHSSGAAAATAAIQRALHGDVPDTAAPMQMPETVIDLNPAPEAATGAFARMREHAARWKKTMSEQTVEDVDVVSETETATGIRGKFLSASCTAKAGTRAYKLYIPENYNGRPLPLIVMLHGCKQSPGDFAAGTGMNAIAEENGCFVLYPAQAQGANSSNCWNWFQTGDQRRDHGEPSILAEMTRKVMREYSIDARRVYIAGLSAGGAMAAIMADAYPDIYAAVGIHSGLPVGAAHDLPSALAAMNKGAAADRRGMREGRNDPHRRTVPAIVFHGDRDSTVHPRNGEQALAQCVSDTQGASGATTEKGSAPRGRSYTRTVRRDNSGTVIAEHWLIHGAGHAWSGGSRKGSYTDPKGPDASREMVRFFYGVASPEA
jgi:poly(hydroxyalkanoate) depolymerase family esterase